MVQLCNCGSCQDAAKTATLIIADAISHDNCASFIYAVSVALHKFARAQFLTQIATVYDPEKAEQMRKYIEDNMLKYNLEIEGEGTNQ